jgi:HSP20 family molecular chaperone IbpA
LIAVERGSDDAARIQELDVDRSLYVGRTGERLQRDFCWPSASGAQHIGWEPTVEIYEIERQFWAHAALPGVEPSNLEVAMEANVLIVSGARRLPPVARKATIHRLEIPHGRFERRIQFASGQLELGDRELENGCLSVVLTKQH